MARLRHRLATAPPPTREYQAAWGAAIVVALLAALAGTLPPHDTSAPWIIGTPSLLLCVLLVAMEMMEER